MKFPYTLRRYKRSKHIRAIVHPGGELVVTAPKFVTQKQIDIFLVNNSVWLENKLSQDRHVQNRSNFLNTPEEYKTHKQTALKLVKERLEFYNSHYNFVYRAVSIRNQKTRWGSCSKEKNLNFNYKVSLIPIELTNYITVHELCHTAELNHSAKFWGLVAQTIPNYRQLRKILKTYN